MSDMRETKTSARDARVLMHAYLHDWWSEAPERSPAEESDYALALKERLRERNEGGGWPPLLRPPSRVLFVPLAFSKFPPEFPSTLPLREELNLPL